MTKSLGTAQLLMLAGAIKMSQSGKILRECFKIGNFENSIVVSDHNVYFPLHSANEVNFL